MKNLIIGFLIGLVLGGGVGYAYGYLNIHLQDANGNDFGTTSNPVYVTTS